MKARLLKKFIPGLISLLIVALPPNLSEACGWSDDGIESYTVIFNRDFFAPAQAKTFGLFSDVLYDFDKNVRDDHQQNVIEWRAFLKSSDTTAVRQLVYSAKAQELSVISDKLDKKDLSDPLVKTLAFCDESNQVLTYLAFVRKCQPYVSEFDDWAGCFDREEVFHGLFQEGEKIAAEVHSDFLKVRIGYQLCRLAHYMHEYDKCITYYATLVKPLKSQSIVNYWAMAHYAGAIKAKGASDEAKATYAQVYRHCTTKRFSSFQSMDYNDISGALGMCTDPKDKVSFMFSIVWRRVANLSPI